jgi:uncharacterized protein (TIGR03086 family)
MSTPRQRYLRALHGLDGVIAAIRDDQRDSPTTCPAWTVRHLTGHVIDAQRQVTSMLSRAGGVEPETSAEGLARLAGADPRGAWRRAHQQIVSALARVDDDAVVPTPLGDASVSQLLATAVIEPLLHAWDLATSVGGTADLEPETVEATLDGVEALGDRLSATGMYAPHALRSTG